MIRVPTLRLKMCTLIKSRCASLIRTWPNLLTNQKNTAQNTAMQNASESRAETRMHFASNHSKCRKVHFRIRNFVGHVNRRCARASSTCNLAIAMHVSLVHKCEGSTFQGYRRGGAKRSHGRLAYQPGAFPLPQPCSKTNSIIWKRPFKDFEFW